MKILLLAAMLGVLPAQATRAGLGIIEGTVTRSGTTAPVPETKVLLPASEFGPRRETTTDANGRFAFTDVAAGIYVIVASREGFHAEGNTDRLQEAAAISTVKVVSNARSQVAFKLVRESILRGRFSDSNGSPRADVNMALLRITYDGTGRAVWKTSHEAFTDEHGDYKFTGVSPGDYYLRAAFLPLPTGSSATGNASTTYYPGTPDAIAAAPVIIRDGEEPFADFKESLQGTHAIRGRFINALPASTDPLQVEISLQPQNSTEPLGSRSSDALIDLRKPKPNEDRFEILNVRPGTYDLKALATFYNHPPGSNRIIPTSYESRAIVQVRDDDVEGVVLTLQAGVDVQGRLIFEGERQSLRFLPERGIGGSEIRNPLFFSLVRKGGAANLSFLARASNEDGTTFTMRNVPAGEYAVQPLPTSILPFSTYVSDVRSGTRSILADGLVIEAESPEPLDVVVRSDAGTIEGTVSAAATPQTPVLLALVPAPQLRGNPARYSSATTTGGGKFTLHGIPPGEYKLFAWEGVEANASSKPYANAAYIGRYESRGTAVKVLPNGTVSGIQVPLIRIGE